MISVHQQPSKTESMHHCHKPCHPPAMTTGHNLFSALRAAFPADLDGTAVETSAPDANLLAALKLPEGSRVAAQVEKSVEALLLYLATLRAGHVFLPLNTA